jgi:3-phosphoshikimate 1-carboxyvinyltransferase
MGARFEMADGERPPLAVHGAALHGAHYNSPIPSAQVKSAILLAGLQADGTTSVTESVKSRDHSERFLERMGANIECEANTVHIKPGPLSALSSVHVPGDLSSAAFFLAVGALLPGAGITLNKVCLNPTRTGVIDALESMDLRIVRSEDHSPIEPVGTLSVRAQPLRPLILEGELLVRAIDEVPILAVVATQATGRSVIRDAAELRVKESDRLAATAEFLRNMGARIQELPDGLIIDGPTPLHGCTVDPKDDHRIAMAAAVAGLIAQGDQATEIKNAGCADVSYPGFFDVIRRLTR